MAHQKQDSTLIEISQANSGNGNDSLKALLRHMIQQVFEEGMTVFLNTDFYEQTDGRRGYRNGYEPRMLRKCVGRLDLLVPKDREGRFQMELFEKYQRNKKALMLAIAEM